MIRTNVVELMPTKRQEKILRECMLLSSCVYNSANYIVRQQFFKGEKVLNFYDLRKELQTTKDYKQLGRVYALPRLQMYSEIVTSRFRLIQSNTQNKVGLPKYLKNRKTNTTLESHLVMDNCYYSITKKKVMLPLSKEMRGKYHIHPHSKFKINYNGVLKHQGKQGRGQIHFRNGKFYLHQSVEVVAPVSKRSGVVAGLDLGIKNLLTSTTNTGQELIIGSNRFFRHWQYLTNIISKEQQKLSKIDRKSSNNLSRLFYKRSVYLDNLFDNVVAKLFRFLKRNDVSKLIIGDLTNILDDNDKGRLLNQMTHNYWSFDRLLCKIENKAEELGIEIQMTSEEYTSRTCPICGDDSIENKRDRLFLCSFCGYIDHRDIVGARNIMVKGMSDPLTQSAHWCEIAPLGVL